MSMKKSHQKKIPRITVILLFIAILAFFAYYANRPFEGRSCLGDCYVYDSCLARFNNTHFNGTAKVTDKIFIHSGGSNQVSGWDYYSFEYEGCPFYAREDGHWKQPRTSYPEPRNYVIGLEYALRNCYIRLECTYRWIDFSECGKGDIDKNGQIYFVMICEDIIQG